MSELTTEQVSEVLDAHPWRFAKTMPDNPHDYTLRKQWDDSLFSRVVQHLREHGYRTWFNGRPYTQYDSGDYFYWTMGAPLSETILINRKLRKTAIAMAYDRIAATYDSLFNDETSKEEEQELFARIGNLSQLSVLDVGCGTGLLLDYAIPTGYCGVDPSQGMIDKLIAKHPERETDVRCMTLEEYLPEAENFEVAVALFGAGSYLSAVELAGLSSIADRLFIMGYWPGYVPVTYTRTGVHAYYRQQDKNALPGDVERWGDYWICERR